jgi:hypothetical protein
MGTVQMLHRPIKTRALDGLTTEEILRMHERVFGPLSRQSKRRMVAEARMRGWDRAWSDAEPIAA